MINIVVGGEVGVVSDKHCGRGRWVLLVIIWLRVFFFSGTIYGSTTHRRISLLHSILFLFQHTPNGDINGGGDYNEVIGNEQVEYIMY